MLWIKLAKFTFLELWKSRVYKALLVLAFLGPLLATLVSSLFMMDIGKVFMDVVASVSQLMAMVFILFVVVPLLGRDIFDKVVYMFLRAPIDRNSYYFGRAAGVISSFLCLLIALFVSTAITGLLYLEPKQELYQSGYDWTNLAQMLFFHFFQYISIIGVVFFLVSWASGDAETMLFTVSFLLFTWFFPPVLKAMQNPEVIKETPGLVMQLLQFIYELLPHLQGADIALILAHGEQIGFDVTCWYVAEHSIYGLIFFAIGLIVFKKRDL